MAKKRPTTIVNAAGGIDLLVERDAGNEVRILTGKIENSLLFWEQLSELCEGAIHSLKDDLKDKKQNVVLRKRNKQ